MELAPLLSSFRRWSAWYSGDPDELIAAYGGSAYGQLITQRVVDPRRPTTRIMWGDPLSDGADDDRLHVPLASDLCAASAELCYADPPQFTATSTAAQDRVGEYVDAGLVDVAAGGHEIGAALGGHYLQAVLPEDGIAQLESVAYDGAWPLFVRGQLKSVAFWWELETDNTGRVWRHFESHELDAQGIGIIVHGLYLGSRDNVGEPMPLNTRPETAYLTEPVWSSGTPGMDVVHIPGRTPQRLWRADPIGRHLGRSVFQGIEGTLSQLDAAYTSWMRDLDLGRSRLLLADWLLQTTGPGKGATFDLDQRLIVPVALPAAVGTDNGTKPIEMVQFAIRVQEHMQTCQELTEVVLRAVSFSAQTFGEDEEGNAQTATAVMSKDSRSMRTRAKMLTAERVGLQQIVRKMLAMDQANGKGAVADEELTVTFPDGGQESILQLAQTAQALRAAEAASDETLVRMVHPDWSDTEVADEVMAIRTGAAARMAITVPGDNVIGTTTDPNANAGFPG
jgi:hypothetical protein